MNVFTNFPDNMNLKTLLLSAAAGLPLMTLAAPHGIDRKNLDLTADPAGNFYQYACGGWMKENPLTAEYSRFGMFDLLRENARRQLMDLINNLSDDPQAKIPGTNAQKIADLYSMGMDSVRLNREGAAPLRPYLDKIENLDRKSLSGFMAWMGTGFGSPFFGTGVAADSKNSDINIMYVGEGGLGLGDRDYYLEKNETNGRIMQAYREYVERIMTLAGYTPQEARRIWETVISIETRMAEKKMKREDRRDPNKRYNMISIDEMRSRYPNINWDEYFPAIGVKDLDKANFSNPAYMDFVNGLLPTLSDRELKDYFSFLAVTESTSLLGDDFYDASFELYDRVMSGKEEKEPRWKRAMAIPNSMFGEAIGQLYVGRHFPEENKRYMTTLVENLRTALGEHIDSLSWMSEATKARAHEKLDAFTVKIGYPDKWKDYSGITIDPSRSYLDNVLAASQWYVADNYAKLPKPVDRSEWHMTPQTVNAYYNPTTNEICFPAAILQPPYFDPEADDAQNYGAIGVVIGHEMTHGFDDQGRQYDKDGNLNEWWSPEDADKFKALADKLVAQFDAVEVAPGVHANGRFTLGENIADQGGLRVAMTAWKNAMKSKGGADKVDDGFTPEQRFYLAYGILWAGNIRPEEVLVRTKTDPHSLGENRVNVTLRNIAPFFEAFGIREGDAMYRPEEERVVIW